jgi:hypothetical protein
MFSFAYVHAPSMVVVIYTMAWMPFSTQSLVWITFLSQSCLFLLCFILMMVADPPTCRPYFTPVGLPFYNVGSFLEYVEDLNIASSFYTFKSPPMFIV